MATFDNTQSLSGQVGFGGNTAGPANEDPALEAFGGGRGNRATEGIIGDYALEQQGYTRPIRNTVTGQITNPYPDSFFSRMFGAENVDYTSILGDQMGNVENARRARFFNTGAVSKGFGSLFGGAEGEMTVAGPRVAQIQPATTSQSLAGIAGMGLGLPVGALSRAARTTYAPEGFLDEGSVSPSALSASSEFLTGISPEAVGSIYGQAADLVDQAKEGIRSVLSDNDVDGVINNLSPAPADDQTMTSPDIRFPDDPSRQTVYEAMLNPDYQSGRHSVALPNGAVAELFNGKFTGTRRGLTP